MTTQQKFTVVDVVAPTRMDQSLVLAYKEKLLQRVVHSLPVLLEIVVARPARIELYLLAVGLDEIAGIVKKKWAFDENKPVQLISVNIVLFRRKFSRYIYLLMWLSR